MENEVFHWARPAGLGQKLVCCWAASQQGAMLAALQWEVWSGRQSGGCCAKSWAVGAAAWSWVGNFNGIVQDGMCSLREIKLRDGSIAGV